MRHDLLSVLTDMGVPTDALRTLPEIASDAESLLLYGSQARGDAVPGSDVDLLAVVPSPRPAVYAGDVNVSYYTTKQLTSGIGTLFGFHLKRDARIMWDESGSLHSSLNAMGEVDTARLLVRAHKMSQLFTNGAWDLPKYLLGLLREARYLLRSCMYAQSIAEGAPCFSIRELGKRHDDPQLVTLLSSRPTKSETLSDYEDCLRRLRGIIGEFPASPHGSLEATIVNEWGTKDDVLSMAFMALGATGAGAGYAEVEKILL